MSEEIKTEVGLDASIFPRDRLDFESLKSVVISIEVLDISEEGDVKFLMKRIQNSNVIEQKEFHLVKGDTFSVTHDFILKREISIKNILPLRLKLNDVEAYVLNITRNGKLILTK